MITKRQLALLTARRATQSTRRRGPKRLPRQVWPHALERQYATDVVALIQPVQKAIHEVMLPLLPGLIQKAKHERGDSALVVEMTPLGPLPVLRLDASGKDVRDAMRRARDKAKAALTDSDIDEVARPQGSATSRFQKAQLGKQLQAALGVDPLTDDTGLQARLEGWVHTNVQLIQSVPNRLFDEVEYDVLDAVGRGSRAEELASDIRDRFDVSDSRAELIARDQIGKLYGQLNEDRQTGLGIDSYVWRTALDERVRPEHAEREGVTFEFANPPEDGNPGEPIQCRCYAEPDVSQILEQLD